MELVERTSEVKIVSKQGPRHGGVALRHGGLKASDEIGRRARWFGNPLKLPRRESSRNDRTTVFVSLTTESLTNMERLTSARPDAVSDAMRAIRVRSSLWCRSAMRAPWGFRIPARDLAAFHLVVSGRFRLEVDGLEPIALEHGDLVVVPNGPGHVARSAAGVPAQLLNDILDAYPPHDGRLAYGGDGDPTELVCGGFEIDDPASRALLAQLPPLLLVRSDGGDSAIGRAVAMIGAEFADDRPGTDEVVSRLADVVLALAIRAELSRAVQGNGSAWSDPRIAATLRAIGDRPERRWTVAELASIATLSRSAFTSRFRAALGESPMRYVGRVRVPRAAELLHDPEATLEVIAARTGFDSDATLSRAFKRYFGVPPGAYRRHNGATEEAPPA